MATGRRRSFFRWTRPRGYPGGGAHLKRLVYHLIVLVMHRIFCCGVVVRGAFCTMVRGHGIGSPKDLVGAGMGRMGFSRLEAKNLYKQWDFS